MRIISKFHDYYDSAMGFGVDKERVYSRETSVVKLPKPVLDFMGANYRECRNWRSPDASAYVIGVAGKICPALDLGLGRGRTLCYSSEEIKALLKDRKDYSKKAMERFFEHSFNRMTKWLNQDWNSPLFINLFLEYKVPVFWITPSEYTLDVNRQGPTWRKTWALTLNPCLKDIDFPRKMDSYTAFQEISMFMSNFLTEKSPEPRPIDDNTKRDLHGFDKFSFRKGKSK